GGNLALAAASAAVQKPSHLFIWDAISSHEDFLRATSSEPSQAPRAPTQRRLFRLEKGTTEVAAFPMTAILRNQIANLALDSAARRPSVSVTWLGTFSNDRLPSIINSTDAIVPTDAWASHLEEFPSSLMVPRNVLDTVRALLQPLP